MNIEELVLKFSTFGIIYVIYFSFDLIYLIYKIIKLFICPYFGYQLNPKLYGSWSIVTGAAKGIGKELALQLASKSSNLVLIDYDEKSLLDLKYIIEQKHKVEVQLIVKDFRETYDYEKIEKIISKIDIGILVNNVGVIDDLTEIYNQTEKSLKNVIMINALSAISLTRMILQKLVAKKKGIIVTLGSAKSYYPFIKSGIYPATKKLLNSFNETLINEYPINEFGIYFNCIHPFYCSTDMTGIKPSLIVPNASDYAKTAINTFEWTGDSNGNVIMTIFAYLLRFAPQ